MQFSPEPLLTAGQIHARIHELAIEISRDLAGREITIVAVLKGALPFAADLLRHLTVPVEIDFIRARSYAGTESSGRVEFTYLPEQSLAGKHVLVVEDIVDTGSSAVSVLERLATEGPASLALCALLDKPSRRRVEVHIDYTGFTIEDHFLVGYGLDYNQRGRELPAIHTMVHPDLPETASRE